jgi:Fe-S cluster biogenesis protein NfuA
LGVKDGTPYIKLTGACGGCSMSLMTTKMVVKKKHGLMNNLKHLVGLSFHIITKIKLTQKLHRL